VHVLLGSAIDNAISELRRALPAFASGKLDEPHHPHAIAVLYRKLGVCRLLSQGVAEPLFIAQMQSVSAYLSRLPTMANDDKVTSRAAVLFDAIGGAYWDAAAEIARHGRASANPAWEHEDDFLYVWFLIQRYFLDVVADDASEDDRLQREQRLRALLGRWEIVLEGDHDPRLLLCDALLREDSDDFMAAFQEVADAREAEVRTRIERGELPEEDACWVLPWWGEGLALLRLADRDHVRTEAHCSMVPQVMRGANPYVYDSRAWTQIDIRPTRRTA
jgi:hypothetical protein